jgi:hypothetical protein
MVRCTAQQIDATDAHCEDVAIKPIAHRVSGKENRLDGGVGCRG